MNTIPPALNVDKAWQPQGRFTRLSYLAWVFLSNLVFNVIYFVCAIFYVLSIGVTASFEETLNSGFPAGILGIAVLAAFILFAIFLYYSFVFTIRRLHDCNRSGWLSLLMLIPVINIIFMLYVFFAPGTQGSNNYGAPRPTKDWEKVLAIIYIVLMALGFLGALAVLLLFIPAYYNADPANTVVHYSSLWITHVLAAV